MQGKLKTRKWTNNDGQDVYTTEVVVDMGGSMQMLDSRSGTGMTTASAAQHSGNGANNNAQQRNGQINGQNAAQYAGFPDENDIPF